MKSKTPVLILSGMILMSAFSWNNVLSYNGKNQKKFNEYIEKAEMYSSKEIYYDAAIEYNNALKLDPKNYDLAMKLADTYMMINEKSKATEAYMDAIKADQNQKDPYLKLYNGYMESHKYDEAYKILIRYTRIDPDDEDITAKIIDLKGRNTLSNVKYDSISDYHYDATTSDYYAVASMTDKEGNCLYGVINKTGSSTIPLKYEYAGLFAEGVVPVSVDGELFYIDKKGNRRVVPPEKTEYIGAFGNNYAPVSIDGVYGYIDRKMNEYKMEYSYAGCFSNNMAAVQKDGKWAVINSKFINITEFEFDEILVDDNGFCADYKVFWAKKDGKYSLYNSEGVKISDEYDEVKLFVSKDPAAVKKDGKWGYVSISGKLVVEPVYEDANSYSLGFAGFCSGGKWGCMDMDQVEIIKPEYEEFGVLTQGGLAVVEKDGARKFITINTYK